MSSIAASRPRSAGSHDVRAVAYLVLCIDIGHLAPGLPMFPTRIAEQRDEYESSLRRADAAAREREGDVPAGDHLKDSMIEQLRSVVDDDVEG